MRKSALSIIEVAIAVVILGVLMVPALNLTTTIIERGKVEKTKQRLEKITSSLDNFFYINKRLPCPADITLGESDSNYSASKSSCGASGVDYGAVPVNTLGLSRDFMFDGYGRKFTYFVSRPSVTANSVRFLKSGGNIVVDDGTENPIATTNKITISSGSGAQLTTDGAFAIVSHGKDGFGANQRTGELLSAPDLSSKDYANYNSKSTSSNAIVSLTNGETGGDDIVSYSTFGSYIPKLIEYGYVECPAITVTANDPASGTVYSFARTFGGNIFFPTQITCSSVTPSKPNLIDKSSMYCAKTGDWVGFRPQICSAASQIGGIRLNNNNAVTYTPSSSEGIVMIPNAVTGISNGTTTVNAGTDGVLTLSGSGGTTISVSGTTLTITSPSVSVSGGVITANSNSITPITGVTLNGTALTPVSGVVGVNAITGVQVNGSNVTPSNGVVNIISSSSYIVGEYKFMAASVPPSGWLLCDGSAVSRSVYSDLFAQIGTSFGVGNGSTTFNLPDFRGRVFGAIGTGTSLTARTMGASIGAETHTLDSTQIPSHTHTTVTAGAHTHTAATGSAGAHTHTAATGSAGAHTHSINDDYFKPISCNWSSGGDWSNGDCTGLNQTSANATTSSGTHTHTISSDGAHTHTISSDGAHTHTINNTGGGLAHNNMQPTLFGGDVYIYSGVIDAF